MATAFVRFTKSALTLRGRVAEQIRAAILSGFLKPGERIVERALAGRFGTSLTVIREAIVQLEAEGFITKRPNSSTCVTQLSMTDVHDIFVVRNILEGFCFEMAARLATAQDIEELEKRHEEALRAAKAREPHHYIQKDLAFHRRVWEMGRNPHLTAAVERAVLPLFAFSAIRAADDQSFDMVQDALGHLALLDGIRRRDSTATSHAYKEAAAQWLSQVTLTSSSD